MPFSEKDLMQHERRAPMRVGDAGVDAIPGHRDDIFFAAIEGTRMPMIVTDPRLPDNPIVFTNNAFLNLTGYSREEVMGKNCRFLQGPVTDPDAISALRESIAQGREHTTEILNYRKNGSTFWNALFLSPVHDAKGDLVYFFASQLDVSRRRDAEDGLRQAQKMEALGQLTGGISHDFNNLLQVMTGHLELLQGRLRKGSAEPQSLERSIQSIRSAIGKASTLTQQLLAFSRKQRLEGRVINLNNATTSLTDLVERTLGANLTLKKRLDPQLRNCQIDPTQFEVALLNILVNARDAMGHAGTVTITTQNTRVDDGLLPAGEYVEIDITDTGAGIPPDVLPHVAEPFFTTKDEGRGTGLGLSMVYGFAKQSGGGMSIDSEVGRGTTVRLLFPATEVSPEPHPQALTPEQEELSGSERILVVDDREEVAELSRSMLESLGYQVEVAHNGQQALALMQGKSAEQMPQLLFSDVIMPGGMNGFRLSHEARKLDGAVKILLTTGFAGPEMQNREFDILSKPYSMTELARAVKAALR